MTLLLDGYRFGATTILILVVSLFLLIQGVWVWSRGRGEDEHAAFLRLVLVMTLAILPIGLSLAAPTLPLAFSWDRWSWFFACLIPAFTFDFETAHLGLATARRWRWLLHVICLTFAFMVPFGMFVTEENPWRHWFGTLQNATWIGRLFLPLFVAVLVWCLVAHRKRLKERGLAPTQRRRYAATYVALFFAALGSLDFLGYVGIPWPPLSFIFFTVWVTLYAYAIIRYRLFRVTKEIAAPTIIASMPSGLFVVNRDGRILLTNEHASGLTKVASRDLVGRSFRDFLPLAERTLREEAGRAVLGPVLGEVESALKDADGREIPVSVSAMSVRDESGGVQAYTFIVTSVQKLKEQLATISSQKAELEKTLEEMRRVESTLKGREKKLQDLEAELERLKTEK